MPNFLDIKDLDKDQLSEIILLARNWKSKYPENFLQNKNILMIFEKPSLRTRVSFEVGIRQLGGGVTILNSQEFKFGERESIFDTAKVLERYVDMIIIRSFDHSVLKEFASIVNVPVINALTDQSHPCQVAADLLTLDETFGCLEDKKISWFGDCNNVTQSWIEASILYKFRLYIACPKNVSPNQETLKWIKQEKGNVIITNDVYLAADGADCILTDTWLSMGEEKTKSIEKFKPFQVDQKLMSFASKKAIFMHCLPAHRNFEVTSEVLEGNKSRVFDEAENRLHVQKAIIKYCFSE